MTDETVAPARPVLQVVRGEATVEELAALLAVVAGRSGGVEAEPVTRNGWTDRAAALGMRPTPGRGAWRAAAQRW